MIAHSETEFAMSIFQILLGLRSSSASQAATPRRYAPTSCFFWILPIAQSQRELP
jgi:hypothetical protein